MKTDLQELFSVFSTENIDAPSNFLALQVGDNFFNYAIFSPTDKKLVALKKYALKQTTAKILNVIMDQNRLLQGGFGRIITSVDFGFNTLLPTDMDSTDTIPLVFLENADQQAHTIKESLEEYGLVNCYSVPSDVLTWLVQNFPSSGYLHAHSVLIKSIDFFPAYGLLRLDIMQNSFAVVAFKGRQLVLSKNYRYNAPADMVFLLLKICEVFNFSQELVSLQVSGLVDKNSKLYRELYEYFLQIFFKDATWVDVARNYPPHYFTTLNELCVCELLQEV